jgi:ureidoacrylate peracid hydrolase
VANPKRRQRGQYGARARETAIMIDYKPDPKRTALIVYDLTNDFLKRGAPFESVRARDMLLPRLKPLIAACRRKGLRIIFANQQYHPDGIGDGIKLRDHGNGCIAGTSGVETYSEVGQLPEDIVIKKRRYDAFLGTDLDLILRQQQIDTLIIVGTSTSIGTETTARCAVTRDYRVIYPSDGTVNRDLPDVGWGVVTMDELLRVVLTEMAQFCRVCPVDTLIKEIDAFPAD